MVKLKMLTIGIETSCDETSFSIVRDAKELISYKVASSADVCAKYGGVVPEIVSRRHLQVLYPLLVETFDEAGISPQHLDLIAVTNRPGLVPSLLVGLASAKAMAIGLNKPLIGVDHIIAHLYAPFLNNVDVPRLPFVGLIVSGGHTELFLVSDWHPRAIKRIGRTRDDAAGEALDKAAKLLGLGYPGGPVIEKMAQKGEAKYRFPCYKGDDFDFSFSGLKTALLYFLKYNNISGDSVSSGQLSDICASFQYAIMDVLVDKAIKAGLKYSVKDIVVGGGVSANRFLRQLFNIRSENRFRICFPEMRFSVDNAAMIAGLGTQWFLRGVLDDLNLQVSSKSYW